MCDGKMAATGNFLGRMDKCRVKNKSHLPPDMMLLVSLTQDSFCISLFHCLFQLGVKTAQILQKQVAQVQQVVTSGGTIRVSSPVVVTSNVSGQQVVQVSAAQSGTVQQVQVYIISIFFCCTLVVIICKEGLARNEKISIRGSKGDAGLLTGGSSLLLTMPLVNTLYRGLMESCHFESRSAHRLPPSTLATPSF